MTLIVFSGPTLPPAEAAKELDALYMPPVSEGDVYRAALESPRAIGIIDGYFENVPSVWHKEILYALSRGIRVFGSASMGALRAAELAQFGMQGVGATFEAFRDGRLEDDDEVAVIHGPAELGYPMLSEAMVNIRRTLSDAHAGGVISSLTREGLEQIAKQLPYRARAYHAILSRGQAAGLAADELAQFKAWLPSGRIDQKREDAVLMLRVMRECLKPDSEALSVAFHFEHTTLWEKAARMAVQGGDASLRAEV
ncbi:MAG: TfuA-like protein [Rhodospirillales bacterium]|nr:TfuA-like protein [Rhodospirillales bacterium]MDH3911014.1 TfuA-like protein [Rhodospirillales bacterium]MDH3968182.1 TfuA-like protein [Rhodospirillales bacterium]